MNATENNNQLTQRLIITKARRHWYDDEKLTILKKYDAKEFYPTPGDPDAIVDPKSGESLSVKLIESWRQNFIIRGILKKDSKTPNMITSVKPKKIEFNPFNQEEPTVKDILLELVKENQILRGQIAELTKNKSK